MKIKAKKAFVSGRWSARRDETVELPAARASRLIALGLAEPVRTEPARAKRKVQTPADKSNKGRARA